MTISEARFTGLWAGLVMLRMWLSSARPVLAQTLSQLALELMQADVQQEGLSSACVSEGEQVEGAAQLDDEAAIAEGALTCSALLQNCMSGSGCAPVACASAHASLRDIIG